MPDRRAPFCVVNFDQLWENEWIDARPHPCPLPRGEGESFAVAGEVERVQFAVRFGANPKKAETAREPFELHESVACYSLSPGERARVRASVTTNFSRPTNLTSFPLAFLLTHNPRPRVIRQMMR